MNIGETGRNEGRVRFRRGLVLLMAMGPFVGLVRAHDFLPRTKRTGAYPPYDGGGWVGAVFLEVPNLDLQHHADMQACLSGPADARGSGCRLGDFDNDNDVDLRDLGQFQRAFHDTHLILAERLIDDREPDFTFRTDWIDFPAGPDHSRRDADFDTVGEFLNDHVYDVSAPAKLDEPFGAILIRFSGFLKITLDDESRDLGRTQLPVWIDVGTMGFDGYRADIGITVYRTPNVNWSQPFTHFGPAVEVLGLYPIEITCLNIYDPDGRIGNPRAGVEVYSWHGSPFAFPSGTQMIHPTKGPATLIPPRVIYQADDALPVVKGDFEADADLDLRDVQWFQFCADPQFFFLPFWCKDFDADEDGAVDLTDWADIQNRMRGPGVPGDGGSGGGP